MSAQFTQAISDLRLVLPAEKIAKLELLDDYDLIAPLLTKHKKAIKKVKDAPAEIPLKERQAKAWTEMGSACITISGATISAETRLSRCALSRRLA